MNCKNPIVTPNTGREVPVPCGQCLNCRINKRRVWTHRCMLEASMHDECSFLTLTYSDENLPKEFHNVDTGQIYEQNSVNPGHHKLFIDRLRSAYRRITVSELHPTGKTIRFFMCGEYGEKTQRPHYHYALFGYPRCAGSGARTINGRFVPCKCPNCSFIHKLWGQGHIYLGSLTQESAQYVCGYVTKKLTNDTNKNNQSKLQGRYPEFMRSSRNPGIGASAIEDYGQRIKAFVQSDEDLPPYLTHNGRRWPLGRYLSAKLRAQTSLPPLKEGEAIKRYKASLHDLFQSKTPVDLSDKMVKAGLPEVALRLLNQQRSLQIEAKHKRTNKEGI